MINTVSLDEEDFEINKDLLRKDFYSEVNKERRDWFFSKVPKDIRTFYQEEFDTFLRQEKRNIKYWIWFELFKQEENPNYPGKTLGDQLNRVEEIIETQDHIKTSFVKKDNKPLFKPLEFSKKFQENPHIDQAFIDRISQKVKDSLVVLGTPQPSHRRINMVKGEISSEAEADELNKIFKEPPNQTVMRIIHN